MAVESTPLLPAGQPSVYDRFSQSRKRVIVGIVSFTGLMPLFIAGSFIPCIPQIAKDMKTTGEVVNLAISVSVLTSSIGSLAWSVYSQFYGRRPIFICALPFLICGSLGVAFSRTVYELICFRVIQAFGSAPGFSVGSGAIADIYRLEERGTAMGIFFAAILLGPALSPLAGGISAYYFTWRHIQVVLAAAGIIALTFIVLFFPETSHPGSRGVDKLRSTRPRARSCVLLNPLAGLSLLRSPNVLLVATAGTAILLTDYALMIPMAYTIGKRYEITNEALIGAFFIPLGMGNIIGAPLAGRISDYMVVKWRRRRNGEWVPEDRLRATKPGGIILAPLSILLSGMTTHFIPGRVGIIINLFCFFLNGLGVDFVLSPSAAYLVDILHSRSSEVMAASAGFRGIIIALGSAFILPAVNTIGVLRTNMLMAAIAWAGYGLILLTIRYGGKMRAFKDIGYSTIETT